MCYLIYDTETDKLPPKNATFNDPRQPNLVQMACSLIAEGGEEMASVSLIVRPDGYTIPREATAIHKISTDLAMAVGVPLRIAVAAFTNLRANARALVAHNIDFDDMIMQAAIYRAGAKPTNPGPATKICTMRAATDIVKLPATERMIAAGYGDKYKSPNLTELHQFLFGEGFGGAHSALEDVRACTRCFIELQKRYGVCL